VDPRRSREREQPRVRELRHVHNLSGGPLSTRNRKVRSSLNRNSPTSEPRTEAIVVDILVVCTANQSRSPMGAELFRRELMRRGVRAQVHSVGTRVVANVSATDDAIAIMRAEGLDISTHRSRPVETNDLGRADMIVTMTRAQLRDLATQSPAAFSRLFTLKELARRAIGEHRRDDENIRAWVTRLGAGRRTNDLLGDDPLDDIEDPTGCSMDVYSEVARELANAISEVVDAGWPPG
jgi:protein-tyrosine-phosphatase